MKEEKAEKKGRERERGGEVNKRREDWKEMGSDRGKKKKGKKNTFTKLYFQKNVEEWRINYFIKYLIQEL